MSDTMVKELDWYINHSSPTDTEHRILLAASKIFMQKGKAGTSMQDIADEAGINRTLLHYYFRSKNNLFDAVFENLLNKVFPAIKSVFFSEVPIMDKLKIITDTYIDLLKDKPYLPFFILQEISVNPERLVTLIKPEGKDMSLYLELIKKQLEEAGITGMDPRHFIAHFIGMVIFPFVARPLFMRLGFDNNQEEYNRFLEERKKEIPEFFRRAFDNRSRKTKETE